MKRIIYKLLDLYAQMVIVLFVMIFVGAIVALVATAIRMAVKDPVLLTAPAFVISVVFSVAWLANRSEP